MKPLRDRLASLVYGLMLPMTALRLILRRKRLIAWSVLPIALTLALSIWGVTALKARLFVMGEEWLTGLGYSPESIAVKATLVFLQIVLFVLAAVSFSFLAGIVASPFSDLLAEAVEPYADPPLPPAPAGLRGKLRAFAVDVVKTGVITAIQLVLILVGVVGFWLPGLNLIPFAAAFWLLAFQFLSYPQTRRGEGLGESVKFLARHPFVTLGFGASTGFLFAIPILSSFTLPLAVVGGTLLYARSLDSGETGRFRLR